VRCPGRKPAPCLPHFAPLHLSALAVQNAASYSAPALLPCPCPAPAAPMQEVDRLLGDICGRVHDALPPRLARAVCVALVAAVQSVLLDGGPYRWEGGGRHAWLLETLDTVCCRATSRLAYTPHHNCQSPKHCLSACGAPLQAVHPAGRGHAGG
jgi:hypothetical protein